MADYTWENELKKLLQAGQSSVIILHGNVRDYFAIENKFVRLREYIFQKLLPEREYKLFYDPQGGIQFDEVKHREAFFNSLRGYDAYHKTNYAENPPKQPGPAFSLMENITKLKIMDKVSVVGVVNYLEQIAPLTNLGQMSNEQRYLIVSVDKWAQNPTFVDNSVTFFLIVENLAKIDEMITRNPFIPKVYIGHPAEETRQSFSKGLLKKYSVETALETSAIARLTAGLSLIQLSRLFAYLKANELKLDLEVLKDLKKRFIESECQGLLEFIEPKFQLSNVAGHEKAKSMLKETATAVSQGKTQFLPMGYLVCGPVGTGKTFMVTCFAGEVGIPVVKFLNFRSQWQGQTEANLEKIINLLKAVHPVVVVIDEADAFLGDRNMQGDSGTSSRVFASLAAFMGDTSYRGKILWFLMTSRPDLLPIDMKRQGRAEEHIALFHAQSAEEEEALFQALARKNKIEVEGLTFSKAHGKGRSFSGADIEAILVRAALRSQLNNEEKLTQKTLNQVAENFLSPNYGLETELQILVAIRECTNKQLIPAAYQKEDMSTISARINELIALLREN